MSSNKQPVINQKEYNDFIHDLKVRIQSAQIKASIAVNSELINLYWEIGRDIVDRQKRLGWGKSVVKQVSKDLKKDFPDLKGFSPQNIWKMRMFYLVWNEGLKNE